MPKSFLQIVASIEQCYELDTMLFEEAIGRLKAYEERVKEPKEEGDMVNYYSLKLMEERKIRKTDVNIVVVGAQTKKT
jgi:hypothetical protein